MMIMIKKMIILFVILFICRLFVCINKHIYIFLYVMLL